MNKPLRSSLALAALLLTAGGVQAVDVTLSGNVGFHNDVVNVDLFLATDRADVRLWTDSYLSGLNFDPTLALWLKAGADYSLLQQVDDDDAVGPGQGFFDAGIVLPKLQAGQYRVTLVASSNDANGPLLSNGFAYDAQTPIAIDQWNQPGYDLNANDQKGSFWRLHLDNVDQASVVPEPAPAALLALGLGALMLRLRGRR